MILGKLRSQSSVIRAMGYADFIRGFGRYPTWILLVIYLSSTRDMSFIEIGLIFFVQSIISFPINIAGGRFIDRVGRRSISLFLPIPLVMIYFLLFISVLYNGNIWFLVVEFVSTGILSSIQWVVINAIITDNSTPSGRLDSFTVMRILGNAGIGIGLVVSGIFSIFQPALFFIVPAVGSIVEFLIFKKYVPESKPSFSVNDHENSRKIKVYRDGLLIIVTVIMAISALFSNQWETPTLPLYFTRFLNIHEDFITILYAINTVIVIMFQYRLNVIAEKIGYVRSFSLGLILYAMNKVMSENESHISMGMLKKIVRKRVPTNGENVPMIPEIAELNPKYSPLLSAGAILEIVTEKKGLARLSPSVRSTTFSARIMMLPVRPKTINDMAYRINPSEKLLT